MKQLQILKARMALDLLGLAGAALSAGTGNWDGSEGDKTLWGTIELRIPGADAERTITGRIATHAVTWG